MNPLKEYIKEHIDDEIINISLDMKSFITMEDVAFMSLSTQYSVDEYLTYINIRTYHDENFRNCNGAYDYIEIQERFENYENICLMVSIIHFKIHMELDDFCVADKKNIFSEEYLKKAWEYAIENNLDHNKFGSIIQRLNPQILKHETDNFGQQYLYGSNTKSARNTTMLQTS